MISKCSSCGGNLKFSPKNQCLMCEKCHSTLQINSSNEIIKHSYDGYLLNTNKTENASKPDITNCPTCGASITLKGLEFSGKCPYCNSSLVINHSKNNIDIDAVVPFKIDMDTVYENYKTSVAKKFFIPSVFKKQPPMDKVKGFYIPSFSFDADTSTDYKGILENTYTDKDGHHHSTTRHIKGHLDKNHKNVFIESSSKISQNDLSGILPFDTSQSRKYQDEFILGYSVEKFEDTIENCYALAKKEIDNDIRSSVLSQYRYDRVVSLNCDTTYYNKKYCYYMLPVYEISLDYKDKHYKTYMNGQTGKVGGGLPKSSLKIAFLVVFILFMICIVLSSIIALCN